MPRRATRQIGKSILINAESPNSFRGLAVVCAWAVVGLVLTGAAIWFGLDVIGSPP